MKLLLPLFALCAAMPLAAEPLPAPEMILATPGDHSHVAAPVTDISLLFKTDVDLVEVKLITPDQREIPLYDAMTGSELKRDFTFFFTLPEPVTLPGVYLIDYSASVTAPDGSASATSNYSSFTIDDPNAPETESEGAPEVPESAE